MLYTAYLKYLYLISHTKVNTWGPSDVLDFKHWYCIIFLLFVSPGMAFTHFPRIWRSNGTDEHCTFSSMNLCYIHSALFLALKLMQVGVLNVCQTLVCVKFRISHKYGILQLPKFKVCKHVCTWSTTR